MPDSAAEFAPASSILRFDQILNFVKAAVPLGIRKIRLTGGEPLLRPKLPDLIGSIAELDAITDLALTTNGVLLSPYAKSLYEVGLRRLNIHLDTMDRTRFQQITRRDDLPRVLRSIEAARRAGFRKIKLNAVAIKGLTEPDLIPIVRFARENGFEARFIEFMPLDAQNIWALDRVLTVDQMIATLEREWGPLRPVPGRDTRAPATQYEFTDGHRVGFIASVTRPFCANCNRLRLTSDGKLRNCLFSRDETDIRPWLDNPADVPALQSAIRSNVWQKWEGHEINQQAFVAPTRPMYSIGG